MKEIYCSKCKNYKQFRNSNISYICYKTILLSSICNKCASESEKLFMEGELIEILKTLGLINNKKKYQKMYNHV